MLNWVVVARQRAMTSRAVRRHLESRRDLLRRLDLENRDAGWRRQTIRIFVERELGIDLLPRMLNDPCGAQGAGLLIRLGEQNDIASERSPSAPQIYDHGEFGREQLLIIFGPPPVDVSVLLNSRQRIHRENRLIDSLSIATEKNGFSLSFVEHAGLWHQESLKEDWLGEYVPIGWERPFPARWMGHFFVTPGGPPSFREPCMDYSFPIAYAKTRMWGVWFEDWNHYPFFFDGPRTIFHFEKTFIPNGEALIYFLEPAAADLYSPCEIVEQALGQEKAAALFDFDANRIRKLKYSTPDRVHIRPAGLRHHHPAFEDQAGGKGDRGGEPCHPPL